ncbi:MAG TPA: ATP-binding protein [Candidatus Limnocylindria bacterium]|jgi:anti-sigma regulatory factor (Ser/Thr protein kinase)|nr:ATP-binding protein [Candidatus Limnocylindria bacterium]
MGWRLRADATGFRFFIPDAALAQNARAIFRRYLEAHATPDSDLYGAELIFGELIANVARHAPGELETNLSWVEGDAVLEVRDRGDGFTLAVALPGDEAENARGLFLVAAYGSQLVHERDAEGSRVRVTLPVRRRERGRPSRGRPLIG